MVSALPAEVAAPPQQQAPTRRLQLLNFVIFQAAWFAAVLGAAHGWPLAGTACVLAAVLWHLAVSARPMTELRLLACVCAIGFVAETASVWMGNISYPSGQPSPLLAPYWMVALWLLLGIALNVTVRWLKGRPWLAAAVAAVAGPLSFLSGVRLGGAVFVHTRPALLWLAVSWALLMPLLMWLSCRFDGVVQPPLQQVPHG